MKWYNKKYVYFEWDDELKGKQVFISDSIYVLKQRNDAFTIEPNTRPDTGYPFVHRSADGEFATFKFAYYDPIYDIRVALEEGKQVRIKGESECLQLSVSDIPTMDDSVEYEIVEDKQPLAELYPIGSTVQLKSGVICMVTCINEADDCVCLGANWYSREQVAWQTGA